MQDTVHCLLRALSAVLLLSLLQFQAAAAPQANNQLSNPSFDEGTDERPSGWVFPARLVDAGYELLLDTVDALHGDRAALIDSLGVQDPAIFGMLNQSLAAAPLRGKRVRFRAAVKTAELGSAARAQLWLRVDCVSEDGTPSMGAFDNMGDRPITSAVWQHYEIVADVADNAVNLTVGVLCMGQLLVWIDDASLEILDQEQGAAAKPTASAGDSGEPDPKQPFWNAWLWLALAVMVVLAYSQSKANGLQRAALRFSVCYWVLYGFPSLPNSLFGALASSLKGTDYADHQVLTKYFEAAAWYTRKFEALVHWIADLFLGIEGPMVMPRGSGDTSYGYAQLFAIVLIACLIAFLWSVLLALLSQPHAKLAAKDTESAVDASSDEESPRPARDHIWLRDLLRSYLRYVLALAMLGYGLHKAGFIQTQFGTASEWQLNRTYGSSSPMGLVWTFMAASPAYTFFAGLCEVLGALLLVFRRTTLLGALVVIGVMLNVVLLNFCYDVPVKLYSFHLMFMAFVLVLADAGRLARMFLGNRANEAQDLRPPYTGKYTIWIQRAFKMAIVTLLFALPVYKHVKAELQHARAESERAAPQVESKHLLMKRGFRWVNQVPFNR